MKKRILFLLMILTSAVLICGCGQQKTTKIEDFSYEMVDGEIVITGYHGIDREIYIPEEINNRPVTQIGEKAFAGYDMTLVVFSNSVKVIGESSFGEWHS